MNSNILEKLGMNTIDPAIFIIVLLCFCLKIIIFGFKKRAVGLKISWLYHCL